MVHQRPSVADEGRASYITKLINAKSSTIKTALAGGTEPLLEERFYTESRTRLDLFRKDVVVAKDTYYKTFCGGQKALQDDLDKLWSARPNLNKKGTTYQQQAINADYEQKLLQPLIEVFASLNDRVLASLSQVDGVVNAMLRIFETDLPSLTTKTAIEELEQKTRRNIEGVWTNITTSNAEQIVRVFQSAYVPLYILFRGEKLPREFLEEWRPADQHLGGMLGLSEESSKKLQITQMELAEALRAAHESLQKKAEAKEPNNTTVQS